MKALLAGLLLLVPVLSACDSTDDASDLTITQTVVASPDLTLLEEAVITAGLDDDLAGTGPFTVFAPNDAAFSALLTQLGVTRAQLLGNTALLTSILKLHVVAGRYRAADLRVGQTLTTLNGQTLTVVASGSGLGLDTEDAGSEANATLTATDISASNGVVHTLGSVMLPVNR